MEIKTFFAQKLNGDVIANPSVFLYLPETNDLVSGLEDKNGNPLNNPFSGNSFGEVVFAAPSGQYDMRIVGAGRDFRVRVHFLDVTDALDEAEATVSQYLVDTEAARDAALAAQAAAEAAQAIAEAEAQDAAISANSALQSANSANMSETTAVNSALSASTSASNAASSASSASTSASEALTYRNEAEGFSNDADADRQVAEAAAAAALVAQDAAEAAASAAALAPLYLSLIVTKNAGFTVLKTDSKNYYRYSSATPGTALIPPNSTDDFPVGYSIGFRQVDTGQLTITGDVGVTILYPNDVQPKTRVQHSSLALTKVDTDTWELTGDFAT